MTLIKSQSLQSAKKRHFLAIDVIPPGTSSSPAYFVGSTAPNNVEDKGDAVDDPQIKIKEIADFLCRHEKSQVLIVIHGYNTELGNFSGIDSDGSINNKVEGSGVKGWYQDIKTHIEDHYAANTEGLVLIGYRWPSEEIIGDGRDSLLRKVCNAKRSLPSALKMISIAAILLFLGIGIRAFLPSSAAEQVASQPVGLAVSFGLVAVAFLLLATMAISIVLTLIFLRVIGYFRDAYRARNFGVPDLVEFIRQLETAVLAVKKPQFKKTKAPEDETFDREKDRVKLSFIGHSMGAFVVTNTVRILSDVFDRKSIGGLDATDPTKAPSPEIGHIFSLGRLVLVSPDIPAETIISSRANFLRSSLRRFQETYLFSNEGDMALKLASTAANYASFPSRTQEGGYRLGNVVIRTAQNKGTSAKPVIPYGIINSDANIGEGRQFINLNRPSTGERALETTPSVLDYLHILSEISLRSRQDEIVDPSEKPIAELFTVFDCTDYDEPRKSDPSNKRVGLLTRALKKRSLNLFDYLLLSVYMFAGIIDTHGGYFNADSRKRAKPEPQLTRQLIYGLACLGFSQFLATLETDGLSSDDPNGGLQALSKLCEECHIQVLLAKERYRQDVLAMTSHSDRESY